jgi:nitrite reductase (NO-forming)
VIAVFTLSFNQTASSIQNGKQVYETNCISCHQEQGEGIAGAFPALSKTGNLTDKNKLVKIILQGMRGPITAKGVKYDGEMASISLTDKETADVINYIRNSWGNKAAMITVADVAAAKKAVVKGYQPY